MFGLFSTQARAEEAVNRLAQAGFDAREIGFVAPGEIRERRSLQAVAAGVGTGTALGGVAGAILGAASVGAIPGIGPVLVAGALVPVVMGALTGASAGGTLGGLLAAAGSQDQALYVAQEVRAGRSLVTVTTARTGEARAALSAAGALDVASVGSGQAADQLATEPTKKPRWP